MMGDHWDLRINKWMVSSHMHSIPVSILILILIYHQAKRIHKLIQTYFIKFLIILETQTMAIRERIYGQEALHFRTAIRLRILLFSSIIWMVFIVTLDSL